LNNLKKEKGKIFVLSGPSGSGKTTLHEKLLVDKKIKDRLVKTISATTRNPRQGEKNKKHYLFFTQKQFQQRIKEGYFLEWKKVFDNYYGTPKKPVEQLLKKGKNVLLCIDVKGAKDVFRQEKKAIGIFVKTPSLAVLKKRLVSRGSENTASLQKRLLVAKEELKEAKRYCYVVVNDTITKSAKELKKIILKELT